MLDSNNDHYRFNDLYQTWVKARYQGNTTIFHALGELDSSKSGFFIYRNGRFLRHKNTRWGGTPPITYTNYKGRRKKLLDS